MKTRLIVLIIMIISIVISMQPADDANIQITGRVLGIKSYKNQLYVLNQTDNNIWRYDERLNLINKIGYEGQGPGEISRLTDIGFLEDKIYTFSRNRLLVFDLDGNFLKEFKVPPDVDGSILLLKDGKVVIRTRDYSFEKERSIIYKVNFTDKDLRNMTEVLVEKVIIPDKYEQVAVEPRIEAKYSEMARLVFISNPSREYLIMIYDEDGHLVGKINKKDNPKIRADASFKESFLNALISSPDKPPTMNADMIKMFFNTLYFYKYLPAFDCFYLDDSGNVYVRTFQKKGQKTIYEKYSPQGKFIKRYFLDDRFVDMLDVHRDIAFTESTFYYLYENEEGEYILHTEILN